jgi:hypothetical protein
MLLNCYRCPNDNSCYSVLLPVFFSKSRDISMKSKLKRRRKNEKKFSKNYWLFDNFVN